MSVISRMSISLFLITICLCIWDIAALHPDPIFVPIDDQSVCERDFVVIVIYADALFAEDELDFIMEGAPQGAILQNYGKCG